MAAGEPGLGEGATSTVQTAAQQAATQEGARPQGGAKVEGTTPQRPEQQQPKAEQERHKLPYYKDTGKDSAITPEAFLKKYPEQEKLADELTTKAKELFPQEENESEVDYQTRIYNELEKRLRFTGDYRGTEDELFAAIQDHPDMDKPYYTVMAVESKRALHLQAENKRLEEDARNRLGRIFRRDVKTEVVHEGDPSYVEGDYEHYFDENQRPKELPKTDLYAFTLVADRLLDIVDPATQAQGEIKTYRQQMKDLEDAMRDGNATQEQREQAGRSLISLRSQFYSMVIEGIRTIDQPQFVNPDEATQTQKDKVLVQMHDRLKVIRTTTIDDLIGQYQGVGTGVSEKHKAEMQRLLLQHKPQLLDFALKGADLMQRRISFNPKLHEVPEKIRYKRFIQGGEEDLEEPSPPATPPTIDRVRPGGTIPNIEPAPPPDEGEPRPPVEEPPTPEPAPVKTEEPPPEPLQLNPTIGVGALHDRQAQEIVEIGKYGFAHDLAQIPMSKSRIRRLFTYIRHPMRFFWQNAIARRPAEQQWIRWAADMEHIAKGVDLKTGQPSPVYQTIPIELTASLAEKALTEGRALRDNKNWFRRRIWGMADISKRLFGLSQTSEQKFAKEWLEAQMKQAPAQRDAALTQVTQRTLEEQTRLGERFAETREGMKIEQSNRGGAIAQEVGETRHEVPPEKRTEVNDKIKTILARYADPAAQNRITTDEALIVELNQYLLSDFRNSLPPNLQQELNAPEVASNILSLAQEIKKNWQRYQTETAQVQGHEVKAWEALQVNVLFGRAEWGRARGKQEMGRLNEWLARRLANRNCVQGTGMVAGALGMVTDVGMFAGAYAGGWVSTGALVSTNAFIKSLGGVASVAGLAGLKETGLDFADKGGIFGKKFIIVKGRYQKEVEQHSREATRGRAIPQDARIRQEMDAVLVKRIKATDTIQQFEQRLQTSANQMIQDQARQLLTELAQLDARIRLTDLSGQQTVNFKVQNYIQFTEGMENDQAKQLAKIRLDSMTQLMEYTRANPQFVPQGQTLFNDQFNANGVFDRYSALAEAQLRVGSQDAQVRQWLQHEGGFDQPQTDVVMQQLFPNMNMQIDQEKESLQGKERILRGLRNRRFMSTAAKTFVGGAIATGLYEGVKEVALEGSQLAREGFDGWQKVLGGDIPTHMVNGHVEADLTPLQRGVLWAENFTGRVAPAGGPAQIIDKAVISFDQGVTYDSANHALIDTRNGKVVDTSDFNLSGRVDSNGVSQLDVHPARDLNGDGRIDGLDEQIATQKFAELTKEAGIHFEPGKDHIFSVLSPAGTHIDATIGHQTTIPDGTHWKQDGDKYDLVVDKYPDKVLINDATFDANGHMRDGAVYDKAFINYNETGSAGVSVTGSEAAAEWARRGTAIDHREWYSYNEPGSQENELRLYTYKDGNAVILDMSKMLEGRQHGLNPDPINVQEIIADHQAGFAISVPGHAGQPLWISDGADGVFDGKLRLDPNDTTHTVTFPDGSTMTMGDISKSLINQQALSGLKDGDIATEVYGRQNVFNLGLNGNSGFIEAGRLVEDNIKAPDGIIADFPSYHLQTFATIRGSGDVHVEVPGNLVPSIGLLKDITDTVPSFVAKAAPFEFPDVVLGALPIRQNIEKSKGVEIQTPYYYREGAFRPGTRLVDIIQRGGQQQGNQGQNQNRSQQNRAYRAEATVPVDQQEGNAALKEARQALEKADRVYVVLGGPIGDAVISTAYFSGIQEALAHLGKNTPITLVVSNEQGDLFSGFASGNVTVLKTPQNGVERAWSLSESLGDRNPLILGFDDYNGQSPTITSGEQMAGKNVTTITNLLASAIELYNNETDDTRRFSHYVEELFLLPKDSIDPDKAKPKIILPQNKDQLYEAFTTRTGIDRGKPQLAVVVEASMPGKRYSMEHWASVLSQISQQHPQQQFNIIFNPQSQTPGYTRTAIEDALRQAGVLDKAHLVSGSLLELAVLLERQDVVLSNDTGLAHVAGALENGPPVVTLFLPKVFTPKFWVSSKKQIPVTLPPDEEAALPAVDPQESDEQKKPINKISPQKIAQKALELLHIAIPLGQPAQSPQPTGQSVNEVAAAPAAPARTQPPTVTTAVEVTATVAPGEVGTGISQVEAYRERAVLDRRIRSLFTNMQTNAAFSDQEKEELGKLLSERLQKAGVTLSQPDDMDMLRKEYAEVIKQKLDAVESYEVFSQTHPIITVDNLLLQPIVKEEGTRFEGGKFNIEQRIGIKEQVSFVIGEDKGEDAIGVSVRPDGIINMALADGMSGSILPKLASRPAVAGALQHMGSNGVSSDTLKAAFDAIQERDLDTITAARIRAQREYITNLPHATIGDSRRITAQTMFDRWQEYRRDETYAFTTLVAAQYDKSNNKVQIALRGDSSFVVFKQDGTRVIYRDPRNSEIGYDIRQNATYRPVSETIENITLSKNDVVILCSDGLEDAEIEAISKLVNEKRAQGEQRLDVVVTDYVREKMKTGIGDDVSVIAFHH